MSQSFGYLEGVETDVNEMLVWGTKQRLADTLQWCEDINITLNESKCGFGASQVVYIGHKLTAQGVKPDESKVELKPSKKCDLKCNEKFKILK